MRQCVPLLAAVRRLKTFLVSPASRSCMGRRGRKNLGDCRVLFRPSALPADCVTACRKKFLLFLRLCLTNVVCLWYPNHCRQAAGVVELVDTGDLKSPGSNTVPVRVRSPAPQILYRGVEQLVARRAHNPEVAGSSPVSATTNP